MKNKPETGTRVDKAAQRRRRQAEALRGNLKKRKQQLRDRGNDKTDSKAPDEA